MRPITIGIGPNFAHEGMDKGLEKKVQAKPKLSIFKKNYKLE